MTRILLLSIPCQVFKFQPYKLDTTLPATSMYNTVQMRLLETDMDSKEKITLQNCRNCLTEDLDPTKSFLSTLACAGVLTDDQRDRVDRQTTRQDKVVTLMDYLPRRGPKAFHKFVDVLRRDYSWLSDKLEDELSVQRYSIKLQSAFEEKLKHTHEYLRNKDTVSKVISEIAVPILLQEIKEAGHTLPSCDGEQALKDIINDQLIPLLDGRGVKHRLDSANQTALAGKISDCIERLQSKCLSVLGLAESVVEYDCSLPVLIDKKLQELQSEGLNLRKEMKKVKRLEEKLASENQKVKAEVKSLKADIRKMKTDATNARSEIKKLKEELEKSRTSNEKLKIENKHLKEHLDKAGIDVRISADFCESK